MKNVEQLSKDQAKAVRIALAVAESEYDAACSAVESKLYWLRSAADSAERALESGASLNSLGELQGIGPGFDAAISRREATKDALQRMRDLAAELGYEDPDAPNVTMGRWSNDA